MKKSPIHFIEKTQINLGNSTNIRFNSICSNILLKSLTAFLGTLSIITAINNAYNFHVELFPIIIMLEIISPLFATIVYLIKSPKKWTLFLFEMVIIGAIINHSSLTTGFKYIINKICKQLIFYYDINIPYNYIRLTTDLQKSVDISFIFFAILISMLIIILSLYKKMGIILFVIGESGIILVLTTGLTISGPAILLGLSFAILVAICSIGDFPDKNVAGIINRQAAMVFMVAVLIAAIFFWFSYPIKSYKKIEYLTNLKNNINRFIETFELKNITSELENIFYKGNRDGMADNKDLSKMGELDEIKLTDEVDLTIDITGDTDKYHFKNFYLKGFVGTTYKDNEWHATDKESEKKLSEVYEFKKNDVNDFSLRLITIQGKILNEILNTFPELKDGNLINHFSIDIKSKTQGQLAYVPYYAYSPSFAYSMNKTDSGFNIDKDRYSYSFYTTGNQGQSQNLTYIGYLSEFANSSSTTSLKEFENNYSKYVEETYLQLPDKKDMPEFYRKFSFIKDFFEDEDIDYCVNFVQSYLKNFTYTLTPGRTDHDQDFVEDFLFNKKKGYCTYFASAGTLLFRMMGVPARYAEGYVIQEKQLKSGLDKEGKYHIDIANRQRHAWVEIYIDRFGWIPIEVTSGYMESGEKKVEKNTQSNTTTEKESTTKEKSTKKPIEPEAPTTSKKKIDNIKPKNEQSNKPGRNNFIPALLLYTAFATLFILILYASVYSALLVRRNHMKKRRLTTLDADKLEDYIFKILWQCKVPAEYGMQHNEIADMAADKFKTVSKQEFLYLFQCMDKERYSGQCRLETDELAKCTIILSNFGTESYALCGFRMKLKIGYIWGIK